MQFIVFGMGLFHLKMACADAVWRVFIRPNSLATTDTNTLMEHVSQIRPKETGKIKTKPGFRCMHEVIQQVGIVSGLDVWRLAAIKTNDAESLEDFAMSKPTWEQLVAMANDIMVWNGNHKQLRKKRLDPEAQRDKQLENTILREEYFLLYKEMSHALNFGDIGRVEASFMPWIYIFSGCGKHKYATEMRRHLENIHFIYPKPLRSVTS